MDLKELLEKGLVRPEEIVVHALHAAGLTPTEVSATLKALRDLRKSAERAAAARMVEPAQPAEPQLIEVVPWWHRPTDSRPASTQRTAVTRPRWTHKEDVALRRMRREGVPMELIAQRLNRTPASVYGRLHRNSMRKKKAGQ